MPRKVESRAMIAAMQRLSANDDFRILRGRWIGLRAQILEAGKDKPSEAQWSKLAGFDLAVMEADFWASKEINAEDFKRRADELERQIGG